MKPLFYLLICTFLPVSVFAEISVKQIPLKWELAFAKTETETPLKWIPATVPGAVQLDIAKAEKYEPYYYAEHWKDYLWMEDQFYTYRASFLKPVLTSGERYIFVSKGIDYQFKIFLNGEELLSQEGMFTAVNLDLTDKLKENNELKIRIYPAPKIHQQPADRSQASHSVKPAVSYGWDWHPRLIPLGIWDETYLEVQPASHINDFQVNYSLYNELTKADINLQISGRNLKGLPFVWTLKDEKGREVLKSEGKTELSFSNPQLWWPHDHGQPYLYTSTIQLLDASGKVKIKLVAGTSELAILNWDYIIMKANVNQAGPTVRCKLPAWSADRFKVVLEVEGHPEYNSEYTLAYQPRSVERKRTTPVMNQ